VVPDSLMCWSSDVSDDLGVAAVVVDEGHRAGPTASDEEVDEKEDLEGVEPSKEVVPSLKALESEARIELPVLCEEDGKTVLRFSELFGVQEPYWVVGHRRGRQKREPIKEKHERVEVDEDGLEEDEETAFKVASQHPGGVWNNVRSETQEIGGGSIATEQDGCALEDESVPRPHEDWLSKHKKYLVVPAEPMKREMDLWAADIANWKRQFPSSNFDHLHQQEWETNILWGPVDVTETCRIFNDGQHKNNLAPHKQLDSKSSSKSVQEKTSGTTGLEVISIAEMDVNMQLDSHWLRPFSVECIGQPTVSGAEHIELQRKSRHPQMLRLESQCFASNEQYQEGTDILSDRGSLTLEAKEKNAELAAGDWFEHVLWGNGKYYPSSSPWRPKVIFDLTDRQMVFEISDTKEGHGLRLHAAAVVLAPPEKESSLEGGDVSNNAAVSSTRFNISNDKFYTNKKTHQQQKSNAKKRAVHGIKVMHSLPAIKLQTMKPKLSNKDLANFHRPKAIWYPHHNEVAAKEQGRLAAKGPMNIILKTLGGKGSKLHVDASETLQILKVKVAKKLGGNPCSKENCGTIHFHIVLVTVHTESGCSVIQYI
jgi:transcription initiation factor TFIID subunit 1